MCVGCTVVPDVERENRTAIALKVLRAMILHDVVHEKILVTRYIVCIGLWVVLLRQNMCEEQILEVKHNAT